jgi:SAM-dependent methyltransferase
MRVISLSTRCALDTWSRGRSTASFEVTVNVIEHNRAAWNRESTQGSEWSTPVTPEVIAAAREGVWAVILTPTRKVPASWFGDLRGKEVLCLASGGGQQAPVLAAAGANVVSFDLSEEQLEKDRGVAERENLPVQCVRGDMADLGQLRDEAFHLIFHPVSNVFAPDVMPVWRECYRVLKPEGRLLAGMMNPCFFLFDHDEAGQSGVLAAKYPLPYGEPGSLSGEAKHRWEESRSPAQFSHSLESQIGGQTAAGFAIVGLYEDYWSDEATPLNRYFPVALATLAVKVTSNIALQGTQASGTALAGLRP